MPQRRPARPGVARSPRDLVAGTAAGAINTVVGSGTLITSRSLALGYAPVTANVSNTIGLVPGALSGPIGYRARARGAASARDPRSASLHARRRSRAPSLLLVLPASAFKTIVPGLHRDRARPRRACSRAVRALTRASAEPHEHGAPALPARLRHRRLRRLLRRRAGDPATRDPRPRAADDDLQRINALKNVLAMLVNRRRRASSFAPRRAT